MSDETTVVHPACAICERRLLPGEREYRYVTEEGTEVTVCELCRARAEAGGWLRPEQAAMRAGTSSAGRRRQRGQLLSGLRRRVEQQRERRPRRPRGQEAEEAERDEAEPRPERPARERPERPAVTKADRRPERSSAGPDLAEAIAAFNGAEQRRTVAGLSRSLGLPRASGLAVRTASGANGVRLTIAWELAWYQWEVGPGKHGPELRQIAKGETVDQLRAADRNWNLAVGEDGALSRKRAGGRA
jgi:hypothetical protein